PRTYRSIDAGMLESPSVQRMKAWAIPGEETRGSVLIPWRIYAKPPPLSPHFEEKHASSVSSLRWREVRGKRLALRVSNQGFGIGDNNTNQKCEWSEESSKKERRVAEGISVPGWRQSSPESVPKGLSLGGEPRQGKGLEDRGHLGVFHGFF